MTLNQLTKFAIAYAKHGWWVVPIQHRKKKPIGDDWEKLRLGSREIIRTFNGDEKMNIGVILGASGVVDIDLDCEEARRLAEYLLPPTGMRFGRNSSPGSHWIFSAQLNGERTKMFEDPEQRMICEIRCSPGSQTVFPPSVHESGETIGFESKDDPTHVDVAKLFDLTGEVAAATLLLRHYPNQGSRHRFALGVAGGLLNARWSPERAERFIEAIATEAADEEVTDRVAAVGTTQRAISEGREVIGWPRISQIIDGSEPKQQYVDRIRRFLNIDRKQAIVARPPPEAQPITPEPVSTEPYRTGESRRAIDRMAATARQLRETGNDLAIQISIWLDRKGVETLAGVDFPVAYAAKAVGMGRCNFLAAGRKGRVLRVCSAQHTPVSLSDRAIAPLTRLLANRPEAIPGAIRAAEDSAKAEATSKGRDKPKPVNTRHTAAAVDEIIGPAPKHTPVRRLRPADPDTAACQGIREQISDLADAAAVVTTIPAEVRMMIADLAKHPWSRR